MAARVHEPIELANVTLRVPDTVVFRAFPAETVVLNLATGRYHGLNPTAGRMLELVAGSGSVVAAAEHVARESGHPACEVLEDVTGLCLGLLERGLLEVAGEQRG